MELTALRKDGRGFPVELSLGGIQQGQRWKAVGIIRDMTAAHEARKQIEEAAARYNSLAEQSRTIVWEVDAAGLLTYVSPVAEAVWGYRPEELAGKQHFYDIYPDEGREAYLAAAFDVIARKAEFRDLEHPLRAKDGRTVWVSTSGMPILGENGELRGYRGADTDITERKRAEEAGKLSEHRYRSLFQHMLNGFTYCKMVYDEENRPVDFITLEANDAFERLTGLRDVVGKRVSEVVPGIRESMPQFFEVQGRVALTGVAETFELDFKAIGRWLSVSVYSPHKGDFVALFEDITERKRQEADREAMVALLRLLNSPNETRELIHAVTGLLQEWSGFQAVGIRLREGDDFPYFESRGFPAEFVECENYLCTRDASGEPLLDGEGKAVLGCLCGDVLSDRFAARPPFLTPVGTFWTNNLTKYLAETTGGGGAPAINRCHTQGFESLALVPLRSSGRILGLLQFHDRRPDRIAPELLAQIEAAAASLAIALEQRRTQAALRSSEEGYRLISENTADVIWLMDVDSGRYTYVSPSVRHVAGYSPEELMAHGLDYTLTPESYRFVAGRISKTMADVKAGKSVPTHVHQLDQVRKDGKIVRTEVSTTVLPQRQGHGLEILGVTRDITERVEAETRWMQAQKLESIGRLAGGVAHDFNNLLTVINGYSHMVLDGLSADDPLRECVAEIGIAGERAAALTKQLLLLSRKQVVELKTVDLNEVIVEVEKMLGRVIGEDIRLKSALSPDLGYVLADPGQLHQVLMNLAINARDAMPSGGTLHIETANVQVADAEAHSEPANCVRLKLTDTGVGMTKEVLSHIFEPFFTTKKVGQGTGLGLATVYGIVKQFGGTIRATSEVGQGTTFEIDLPRVEPVEAQPAESVPAETALHGTETILVVEDQEQLRTMVGRILRGHGYKVKEAANAGEAFVYAEQYRGTIDLLLTDLVMPGMSGHELAMRLKQLRPDMEIVFMSGYNERAIPEESIVGTAFLAKPFSAKALAVKVREVLDQARAAATILVADDEPRVRAVLRKILTAVGYRVLEAANGKEAVEQIEACKVDLLITDLAMPEQEGIETIRILHRARPNLKIIAMSGQFAGPLLEAAEKFGARASIAKPIDRETLLETVARVLVG